MSNTNNAELIGEDVAVKAFDNNNTGAIFRNEKRTKDTQPTSRGRCEVNGVHYWVSGWNRKSSSDQPFISLAFTEMTAEDIEKYVK